MLEQASAGFAKLLQCGVVRQVHGCPLLRLTD